MGLDQMMETSFGQRGHPTLLAYLAWAIKQWFDLEPLVVIEDFTAIREHSLTLELYFTLDCLLVFTLVAAPKKSH